MARRSGSTLPTRMLNSQRNSCARSSASNTRSNLPGQRRDNWPGRCEARGWTEILWTPEIAEHEPEIEPAVARLAARRNLVSVGGGEAGSFARARILHPGSVGKPCG